MRKALIMTATVFVCIAVTAQKISFEQFKNLKPRNIGPAGMSGYIN
jgi:hypothetical protein